MINDHEWRLTRIQVLVLGFSHVRKTACAFGNAEIINDEKYDCSYNDTS